MAIKIQFRHKQLRLWGQAFIKENIYINITNNIQLMNKQAPLNTSYQTCFYSPRTILSLATFALVLLDSNFGLVLLKGAPE